MKWAWGLVSLSAIVGLSLAILCTKRPAAARAEVEAKAKPQAATAASATPRATTPKAVALPDRGAPLPGLTLTDVPASALQSSGTPASGAAKPDPVFPALATPSSLAHTKVPNLPPAAGPGPRSSLLGDIPPTASAAPTLPSSAAPAVRDAGTVPAAENDSASKGVQLEWVGAKSLQVGQLTEYSLMVRNRSTDMVHDAAVHLQVPAGIEVKATTPPATGDHGSRHWRFETLLPGQVVHLHVSLLASAHGNSVPQASISYTRTVAATLPLSAYQPKLALHVKRPTRVVLGDTAGFTIHVTNPGDGPAENVTVHAALSAGLDHPRGKLVDFDLGNLAAAESREIQLVCAANGDGEQHCDVTATARAGVHATDQATIRVLAPRLDLQVKGPTVRYVERRANYTMLVANKGDFPAYNVSASEILPAGFRFLSASGGGHFEPSTNIVSWFVGELGPGQTRAVQFEVQAVRAGSYEHRMQACSERGGRLQVERRLATHIEDISALQLEVTNRDNTIEIGKETVYEVVVSNAGSKTEANLRVICTLPPQLAFLTARGPAPYHAEGNTVVFEPINQLAPRGELVYKVTAKTLSPGQVHFQARLTGNGLAEPIIRLESTRIYADRP